MNREKEFNGRPGITMLFLWLALILGSAVGMIYALYFGQSVLALALGLLLLVSIVALCGLFMVNPNEFKVLQLFGDYVGTTKHPGLRWANPFYSKKSVSVRTRNFETGKLKVNDKSGNPIEIAAVVVWRVVDTAEALFNVDDYINFVHVQSESAIRNLATHYAYVADHEGEMALSSHTAEISVGLRDEIQARL
jgi:regulator of protease activity HflC (stomatin/prohibitin superfamily)